MDALLEDNFAAWTALFSYFTNGVGWLKKGQIYFKVILGRR